MYEIPIEVKELATCIRYRATIAPNEHSYGLNIIIEGNVALDINRGLVQGFFRVSHPDSLAMILVRGIRENANNNINADNFTHIYSEKYKHSTVRITINDVIFECVSVNRYKSERNKFMFIGILDQSVVKILRKGGNNESVDKARINM